jgi:hypothetical protein
MRRAGIGLALVVAATTSASALDGPGRALIASNTIRASVTETVTGPAGSNIERSFIPPYSGTVRLTWQIRSKDGTQVGASASVTHLSNCPEALTNSTTFVAQSCDIRVTGGMPVTVTGFANSGGNFVSLHNVAIRYNVVDFDGKPITWEVPQTGRPRR